MKQKSWKIVDRVDELTFRKTCEEGKSMAAAAAKLGLHFNSFKKRALELGCYQPNQSGIGTRKNIPKVPIEDIIHHNLHPHYQSYKLKKRLVTENIKPNYCETCGIDSWRGKKLSLELHHIDGNRTNHSLPNLSLLCPNCHSQTNTFRARNRKGAT